MMYLCSFLSNARPISLALATSALDISLPPSLAFPSKALMSSGVLAAASAWVNSLSTGFDSGAFWLVCLLCLV